MGWGKGSLNLHVKSSGWEGVELVWNGGGGLDHSHSTPILQVLKLVVIQGWASQNPWLLQGGRVEI